jgi:hypothetical protein
LKPLAWPAPAVQSARLGSREASSMRMHFSRCLAGAVALAVFLPTAVLAVPHGKPGLWNYVSTVQMANMPKLPPQVIEMMKKRGMPAMGDAVKSQMCMTEAQMKMDTPPQANTAGMKCTVRVISQTGNSAVSETVCHGRMEGTGRTQITWRGETHYDGMYSFKGTMSGRAQEMSSRFSGDWVKADCGAVKPFDSAAINRPRPPAPR